MIISKLEANPGKTMVSKIGSKIASKIASEIGSVMAKSTEAKRYFFKLFESFCNVISEPVNDLNLQTMAICDLDFTINTNTHKSSRNPFSEGNSSLHHEGVWWEGEGVVEAQTIGLRTPVVLLWSGTTAAELAATTTEKALSIYAS